MASKPPKRRLSPRPARPYHHGNLRAALLAAAERELAEQGIEKFSLRGVAKRAGVSHAAPAHHFGDASGLLTALSALGFERFLATQAARQASAAGDGLSQLVAAGLGYIDFARTNPALFRLMFSSDRPDHADTDLCRAAQAAYAKLEADVRGASHAHAAPEEVGAHAARAWAAAHGLADLLVAGRLHTVQRLAPQQQEAALEAILRRAVG